MTPVQEEKKYEMYCDLYKHYSSLIFKARVSIITALFLTFGYILKIIPHYETYNLDVVIPVCSSYFISGIFILEVAYSNRYFQVIKYLKMSEVPSESYFGSFRRKHWHFNALYFFAIVLFTIVYAIRFKQHHNELATYLFTIIDCPKLCAITAIKIIGVLVAGAIMLVPFYFFILAWIRLHQFYYKSIMNWNIRRKDVNKRISKICLLGEKWERILWLKEKRKERELREVKSA